MATYIFYNVFDPFLISDRMGNSKDQQRKSFKYLFLEKSRIDNLDSSAWSGTLGRWSSWANDTSDKSKDELLKSQNDFKEVLGEARKRLGAV